MPAARFELAMDRLAGGGKLQRIHVPHTRVDLDDVGLRLLRLPRLPLEHLAQLIEAGGFLEREGVVSIQIVQHLRPSPAQFRRRARAGAGQ